jgi:hypothetical protein
VDPDAEVIGDRLGSKQRPPPQGLVLLHTGIERKERRNLDHEDGGERGATLGRDRAGDLDCSLRDGRPRDRDE